MEILETVLTFFIRIGDWFIIKNILVILSKTIFYINRLHNDQLLIRLCIQKYTEAPTADGFP